MNTPATKQPPPVEIAEEPTDMRSFLAMVDEIFGDVPNEVWDTVPEDGALNVDHYLYGAPKR